MARYREHGPRISEGLRKAKWFLIHPGVLPFAVRHPHSGEVKKRLQALELARDPWPEVRRRTLGKSNQLFRVGERSFPYFYHDYNVTWANERCVELAIAFEEFSRVRRGSCLEIGNVLSHYIPGPVDWTVLDKYEKQDGILNVDVSSFSPPRRFDLIISISTLEHVGWDESPFDPTGTKLRQALGRLPGLLSAGGKALVTFPVGYNTFLDRMLREGDHPFASVTFLRRQDWANSWTETQNLDQPPPRYGNWRFGSFRRVDRSLPAGVYPWANVLAVARIQD